MPYYNTRVNEEAEFEGDFLGTWKVYKNGTLLITVSQMPLKTGASGCYFLGSSYGGFNTVDIESLKINKL